MKVKLISVSSPVKQYFSEEVEQQLEDEMLFGKHEMLQMVAYCARISNPGNQNNKKTADKLVKYLMNNDHWSPFEMVNICVEIESTRDIVRQMLRHRSFSFQEFSQRYADVRVMGNSLLRECRLQDNKNRQNSIPSTDIALEEEWFARQREVQRVTAEAYDWAIENDIAKEIARVVLPEGLTTSRVQMNGTLRSWMHYIKVRRANGTQKEHMDIALAIAKIISEDVFPIDQL